MSPIKPAIVALFFLPLPALADDQPSADLAVQLSPTGLSFVAAEVPRYLPRLFKSPGFTSQLVNCPFTDSDTDLTVSKVKTSVTVSSVSITPGNNRLTVRVGASASGVAELEVTRPYGCVGYPLQCNAGFQVSRATAVARFTPTLEGGGVRLRNPQVDLYLSKQDVSIEVSDCGFVGTLLNLVLPLFKGHIVQTARDELEQLVRDEVPAQVEPLLSGMTTFGGQVPGFSVSGSLSSLTTRGRGVELGARVEIEPTQLGGCSLPDAAEPSSSAAPALGSHQEHVGLGVSRELLQRALLALWRSGGLCGDTDELRALGLPHRLPAVGAFLIGLKGGGELEVHTHRPPRLELLPGDGARLRVTLDRVVLQIQGEGAEGPTTITATATASAELQVRLDPESRTVVLDVLSAGIADLELQATNPAGLRLQPTLLSTVVQGLIMPLIEQQLSGMELGPDLLHESGGLLDPYYLFLSRGATSGEHVYLYASVFARPAHDATPPSTAVASSGHNRWVATGTDDRTPAGLLRYRWRVDSGPWTAASYAPTFGADLQAGSHVVEVVAVDLNGNVDPSAARALVSDVGKGDDVGLETDAGGGCALARERSLPGGAGRLPAGLLLLAAVLLRLRRA